MKRIAFVERIIFHSQGNISCDVIYSNRVKMSLLTLGHQRYKRQFRLLMILLRYLTVDEKR